MTWLDFINLLEMQPYYLLKQEIRLYTHDTEKTVDYDFGEVVFPTESVTPWDPDDGMILQIRLAPKYIRRNNELFTYEIGVDWLEDCYDEMYSIVEQPDGMSDEEYEQTCQDLFRKIVAYAKDDRSGETRFATWLIEGDGLPSMCDIAGDLLRDFIGYAAKRIMAKA